MAGLIGNIGSFNSSGLENFLMGRTATAVSGSVEQFRSNIRFNYGDILTGAASDGTLFDIKVTGRGDYQYGTNLSANRRFPIGVFDTGDGLTMDPAAVRKRFEQGDIAKVAHTLLLASKGEIGNRELQDNPSLTSMSVLKLEEALDRLNIDTTRAFRINGTEMQFRAGKLSVTSRPGQSALSTGAKVDPEIDALRRGLEAKQRKAGGLDEVARVSVKDASISRMIPIREDLEQQYRFVAYSFEKSEFVASNSFSDVFETLAEVPDAFFFGASLAWQLEDTLARDLPPMAREQLFPITLNYFSALTLGAMTGLPTQLRDEYMQHAENAINEVYGEGSTDASRIMDALRPRFEETSAKVFDTLANLSSDSDLRALRKGLGIQASGATYTIRKYVGAF